ncbi:HNH endonuclease [Planococcus ruber]|uniref:HNH endonuclease n=1 Tax=Planococcus ruber TaxID=2027871 RepID=UPI001FED8412|nr:HNH endonuclease signature motif containing protein [Planococcus ruber]MCJ1907738.1 HNH endonuclease [Planococcus ruber]
MEDLHLGLLKKFQYFKGTLIVGKIGIKGVNNVEKLPADEFVDSPHILHDLIRGFYKPALKPYLLSYQATESDNNYGKQIIWDDDGESFLKINMHPPRGERDNRKISDVAAARYNLKNDIPFGILHKIAKGQNMILGLGKIVEEREDGVFVVEPFEYQVDFSVVTKQIEKRIEENFNTDLLKEVVLRRGQRMFKNKLLQQSQKCAMCNMKDTRFLIASHIKPWRLCSNKERMDTNNGFLLCPNHDKVFDNGYISFTSEGKILISSKISKETQKLLSIDKNINIAVAPAVEKYLKWHREYYFNA